MLRERGDALADRAGGPAHRGRILDGEDRQVRDGCAHELGLVPEDHHHRRKAGLVGHASGARYHSLPAKLEELFVAPHARGKTRR